MKLSQLEKLVAAMRDNANRTGIEDPNVEFYDDNKQAMREALERNPFCNMEPALDNLNLEKQVWDWRVPVTGSAAQCGDFAVPMKPV